MVPELTNSMNERLTLATGLDALSHAMEGYWAKGRNPAFTGTGSRLYTADKGRTTRCNIRPWRQRRKRANVSWLPVGRAFVFNDKDNGMPQHVISAYNELWGGTRICSGADTISDDENKRCLLFQSLRK